LVYEKNKIVLFQKSQEWGAYSAARVDYFPAEGKTFGGAWIDGVMERLSGGVRHRGCGIQA
jgi:hypothetical protein